MVAWNVGVNAAEADLGCDDRSTGFEVCRRIKRDPRTARIPVIFVTALNDTTDRVKAIEGYLADNGLMFPAAVDDTEVRVSPPKFGAGPVVFIVSNQSSQAQRLTFETDELGGDTGGIRRSTREAAIPLIPIGRPAVGTSTSATGAATAPRGTPCQGRGAG